MNLERTVIALGFFDGVHRGHGALLQKTVQRAGELGAIPAVFTFDRPPKEVVTGRPMPLINSPEDRADLARRIGEAVSAVGGSLMLTFSRRTPDAARAIMTALVFGERAASSRATSIL